MKRNVFIIIVLFVFNIEAKDFNKNIEDSASFYPNVIELQEVIVESPKNPVLHILAYVREYSSLTTYSDTIFLFREKIVDYMLPQNSKVNFKGWTTPRILTSKSYYKFTNSEGLDSVSDECLYHFSWSDWIGLPPRVSIPLKMRENDICTDTLHGKYRPVETWNRVNDKINVNINLLADTVGHKWVPSIGGFLKKGIDYEEFKISYSYSNITREELSTIDLESFEYTIESTGRGREMFRFNLNNQPFYVNTHAEIFIIDKEIITKKEAIKREKKSSFIDLENLTLSNKITPVPDSILTLIKRVHNIDKGEIRLKLKPDKLIGTKKIIKPMKTWEKAISLLKKIIFH